jgi:hypothetical protein
LTLRAALASTRYRRERAQRAAQEGDAVERDDLGAGGEAAAGEQPAGGSSESDTSDRGRIPVAINVPAGGGLVPPPTASITSRDTGLQTDHLRTALLALQAYAEGLHDDVELAAVHKCIVQIQSILADHAKDRAAAMGESPALRHVRRTSRGSGY